MGKICTHIHPHLHTRAHTSCITTGQGTPVSGLDLGAEWLQGSASNLRPLQGPQVWGDVGAGGRLWIALAHLISPGPEMGKTKKGEDPGGRRWQSCCPTSRPLHTPGQHWEAAQSLLMPIRGQKNVLFVSLLGAPSWKGHTCPASCLLLRLRSQQAPHSCQLLTHTGTPETQWRRNPSLPRAFRAAAGGAPMRTGVQRYVPNRGHDVSVPQTPG